MSDPSTQPAIARPTLIGVGVGPGDPELLTLKAVRAIREADVVFAPVRHAGDRSMALQIVADHLDPTRQEIVTVPFPRADHGESWGTAGASMVNTLGVRRGVFLTEGDPLLFGSFGDVLAALDQQLASVSMSAIPGISSVTASAAASLLPLTDHEQRLAIVPATAAPAEIEAALRQFDCVVLLKVGRVLGALLDLLSTHGRLDTTVYVRRCGWPDQEIVHDVRRLRASPPRDYFALLIVHRPRHTEEHDGNIS